MIAVADASPLCYLVLIGEIDLLRQLSSQVVVPHAVILELLHADAPAAVRAWGPHEAIVQIAMKPDTPRGEALREKLRANLAKELPGVQVSFEAVAGHRGGCAVTIRHQRSQT